MRLIAFSLLTLVMTSVVVSAKPPKKPYASRYSRLWTHSPFTIKPVKEPVKVASPLERDWALGSIRPGVNGYSVTLINKKDRKDRIRFLPGVPAGDFQLLEVQQDGKSYKNSRVRVRKGGQTAWLTYDEQLLKVRRTAKTTPRKTSTQRTSSGRPPIPGRATSSRTSSGSSNSPRVRRVPRSSR